MATITHQSKGAAFRESANAAAVSISSTSAVVAEAERLRARGVDLVDLGAGEPDFPTPANIKAAAVDAIDLNFTRYTPTGGTSELKDAIRDMMRRDFAVQFQPSEVIVTVGGKQAIFNAMAAVLDPGDEVLIPSPYWVTIPEIVKFLRGVPVFVETEDNGFVLTADAVRARLTDRSRLLVLNSPSNPSGRVIPSSEFQKIVELAAERGVLVISDECYLHFAYSPARPFTASQLPEVFRAGLMVCGSFSKTYAMTGWRVGFGLGPEPWIRSMLKMQSHSTSNANSIAQKAAVEAALGSQDSVRIMAAEYRRRRDWLIPALNAIPGMSCLMPEGAFYAFPNVKCLLGRRAANVVELSRILLEQAGVVVTPGSAFGAEGYLRLSYANSLEAIQEGVRRVGSILSSLAP